MGAKEGIRTVHNEYTYDEQRGNLVEIRHNTDGNAANDVVYSFEQDALGRQTAVKVGNQTLSQSQYQNDPTKPNFGTLTATTYGNGAKVSSRYDDFNRVTGVVYGEETAPRYEYDYNAKGQVARVRDNLLNRTTQSEYDLANRPVRVKTSEDAKHVYTGQVAYDNVYGNLSEFTEKVGENRQEFGTKFGYDDENRPTSLTYSIGATTIGQSTTTIDKLNRTTFSAVKLGSKTFTSEYHFAAGGYGTGSVTNLVSSITQPGCNCGYGYDDNGNIASATLNGKWTGYTYDALGQLIQVNDHSDTRSGENGTTWKYTYDLGGNILQKQRFAYKDTTNPLETVTYEYGDANWRDKLTAVNGSTIRYDAIGNPLSDGTWTYTWQNGRQLQKMQKSGVTAEFVYNADGLRVQKTVNGVATKYTLHGKNIVHMTSGADELHIFYDAQNRPAVVVYNGAAYAYVKNLQGDIVAILDENGNTVVSYGYDAWGAPLWCTGELAETLGKVQPFRYRGYVFDEETGLYYLRSRYYNPGWGRFANADALTTINRFAYCNNSVISHIDPDGKREKECAECEQGVATSYEIYTLSKKEYRYLLATLDGIYPLESVEPPLQQVLKNIGVYTFDNTTEEFLDEVFDKIEIPILGTIQDTYDNVVEPYITYSEKCGEFITNALARDIAINDPDEVKIIISFSHAKDEIGIMCFRAGRVLSTRAETQSVETIREVNALLGGRVRNEHGHFRSSYESLQDIIQRIEKGK